MGRRDRLVIGVAAVAGVLCTAVTVAVTGPDAQRADSRCLKYDEAGVMGGGSWRLCGADAVAFCTTRGPKSHELTVQCTRFVVRARTGS